MLHASKVILYIGQENIGGVFYQYMSSLVFTAFALEAYLNHIGEKLFGCWDDLKRISPLGKLNVIAEKLGVEKDDGKRPFQTIKVLFDFRNDIAHGKTISLNDEYVIIGTGEKLSNRMHKELQTEWEKYCNMRNAELAIKDVEKIIRGFHDKAGIMGIDDDTLFSLGSGISGVELIKNP